MPSRSPGAPVISNISAATILNVRAAFISMASASTDRRENAGQSLRIVSLGTLTPRISLHVVSNSCGTRAFNVAGLFVIITKIRMHRCPQRRAGLGADGFLRIALQEFPEYG